MKGISSFFFSLIVSILLVACSNSVCAACYCPYNGFYGGIALGQSETYGRLQTNSSAHSFDSSPDEFIKTVSSNNKILKNNPLLAFQLGYSHVCLGKIYLGGELGANISRKNISVVLGENFSAIPGGLSLNESLNTSVSAKLRSFEFNLDFTPGILLTENYLLYGRIGVAANRIKLENSTQFIYLDNLAGGHTNNAGLFFSSHKNLLGLRLGTGLAHVICPNLVLQANYIYTYYGNNLSASNSADIPALSPPAAGANAVSNGLVSSNTSILKNQAVTLGLNYYFGDSNKYENNTTTVSTCDYSGFFGGLSAGVNQMTGKLITNTSLTYIDPNGAGVIINRSHNYKIKTVKNSPDVGLLIGYSQLLCDQFYLGGELGGTYYTKTDVSSNINSTYNFIGFTSGDRIETQSKAKFRKIEITTDITPGFVFSNHFLLYSRFGLAFNRFKFDNITNTNIIGQDGFSTSPSTIQSIHKSHPGFRIGLGVGQYICENLVLNANYIYTWYQKANLVSTADTDTRGGAAAPPLTTITPNGLVSNNYFRLSKQTIMLGLNYYFGN